MPHAVPLRAGGTLPCPVAGSGWGVGVGAVVTQGLGLLVAVGGSRAGPIPRGLFSVEGAGVFFLVGIKITPRPSSLVVDGVGVQSMLTNSIHPEGGNCEVLSPHLRWLGHRAVANVASQSLGLYDGCAIERGGVELVLMIEDVPGDTGCISPRLGLCVVVVVVKD